MKRNAPVKYGIPGVLLRYFRKDKQAISEFKAEIKALTDNERLELAQGAAQEMNLTESEVLFSLR